MGWKERQAVRQRLGLEKATKNREDNYHTNPYTFDPDTRYTIHCVVKEPFTSRKGYQMWKIYFLLGHIDAGIVFYDRPWHPTYSFRIGQYYEVNLINGKPFLAIRNIVQTELGIQKIHEHKQQLFKADLEVINDELKNTASAE